MADIIIDSWVIAQSNNIPRSIRFYKKLGLKPSRHMGHYVEFKAPGGTVLSVYAFGKKRAARPSGGWRIILKSKRIDAALAALKKRKIDCHEIKTPGGRMYWFADPDGNRLLLVGN